MRCARPGREGGDAGRAAGALDVGANHAGAGTVRRANSPTDGCLRCRPLADGSDIAIVPSPPAWDLVGRPPSSKPRGSCRFSARRAVVVFVHVPPSPGHLSARCVHIRGPAPVAEKVAGDVASPTSLLLANLDGSRANVERIAVAGTVTSVLTLGGSLPVAIDRVGEHVLYLVGHSPPALWEATIADGGLTDARRLIADSKLGVAAW